MAVSVIIACETMSWSGYLKHKLGLLWAIPVTTWTKTCFCYIIVQRIKREHKGCTEKDKLMRFQFHLTLIVYGCLQEQEQFTVQKGAVR